MTSPAQLQYLDAMGIPVWVSRDLVLELDVDAENKIQHNNPKLATNAINQAASGDFKPQASHQHVDSLLHDLNAKTQSKKVQRPPPPKFNNLENTAPVATTESTPSTPSSTPDKQTSEIARTASHTVYGRGDLNADWMIIGESPDMTTNGQGQPYAGESGVLLNNMLSAIGIKEPRRNAYLINTLKYSTQQTSAKSAEDIAQLNQILIGKIQQIKPKIVLVVGQIAAQNLLKTKEPLIRLRAKQQTLPDTRIPLVVTYYPSYLLSKPLDKRKVWEDLKLALSVIQQSI